MTRTTGTYTTLHGCTGSYLLMTDEYGSTTLDTVQVNHNATVTLAFVEVFPSAEAAEAHVRKLDTVRTPEDDRPSRPATYNGLPTGT